MWRFTGCAEPQQDRAAATEALASALGRTAEEGDKVAVKKAREALLACRQAFNAVHVDLEWLVERSPEGTERERARNLLVPLNALLDRHQPVAPPKPAPGGQPA